MVRYRQVIPLDELAQEVGCSRSHLCRVFKAIHGLTIYHYVHRLRVHEARALIVEGREDLSSLALDLGFSSHSHFTSVFHRELGITPSELRRSAHSSLPVGCDVAE